MPTAHYYS